MVVTVNVSLGPSRHYAPPHQARHEPPIGHRMRVMENELVGKYTMPGIGFGTLGNVGDAGSALVEAALAEGYRYIDTSRFYGNEEAVGSALARSSVPRGDVWVTTKLLHPRTPPQPDLAFELEKSLRLLRTDYVDLLLMRENLKVLDFTLTNDEMAAISALARGTRIVNPKHGPAWDPA